MKLVLIAVVSMLMGCAGSAAFFRGMADASAEQKPAGYASGPKSYTVRPVLANCGTQISGCEYEVTER
jgi:hypothetical protein